MSGERQVRDAFDFLNGRLTCTKPVRLVFHDVMPKSYASEDDDGYCKATEKYYTIGIRRQKCANCMLETMLHEFAHARAWARNQTGTYDHDPHYYLERWMVDREFTDY